MTKNCEDGGLKVECLRRRGRHGRGNIFLMIVEKSQRIPMFSNKSRVIIRLEVVDE